MHSPNQVFFFQVFANSRCNADIYSLTIGSFITSSIGRRSLFASVSNPESLLMRVLVRPILTLRLGAFCIRTGTEVSRRSRATSDLAISLLSQ